jgi:hypothetical protein
MDISYGFESRDEAPCDVRDNIAPNEAVEAVSSRTSRAHGSSKTLALDHMRNPGQPLQTYALQAGHDPRLTANFAEGVTRRERFVVFLSVVKS